MELSWNPEQNRHLTAADVMRLLSPDTLTWLSAQPNPVAAASSRADGAWQANDRERFAAYTRFAELALEARAKGMAPRPKGA